MTITFSADVCAPERASCVHHRRPPFPNPRSSLWCDAAHLLPCASASPPPAHVPLSPGPATASDYAASRSWTRLLGRAFFRLPGLAHGRLRALKARVPVQNRVARIRNGLLVDN